MMDEQQPPAYDASKYSPGGGQPAQDPYNTNYSAQTVTHATVTATHVHDEAAGIGFKPSYLKTIPAILKYVEIGCSLICAICVAFNYATHLGGGGFGSFVATSALFTSVVWFIICLFNIDSKFHSVMYLLELIYYAVYVVLYFIAWAVAIDLSVRFINYRGIFAAYAIFATFAMIAFAIDCFFQYRIWRANSTRQHTSTTQQTTVTSTNYSETTNY